MVQEGIMLGHRVSSKGIEVDRAKNATIEKLPASKECKRNQKLFGTCGIL